MFNNKKLTRMHYFFWAVSVLLILAGCEGVLDKTPPDQVSEKNFWKSEKDAEKALTGLYSGEDVGQGTRREGWGVGTLYWTDGFMSDMGLTRRPSIEYVYRPTVNVGVADQWRNNYVRISRVNYFLENIDKVDMDKGKKAEMIAEAKFIRSYAYFWLSQLFGRVPLVKKTLTFEEANSVKQASKEDVENFAIEQLTAAVKDLPVKRPASELGKIEKGAALALKGRFLMAQKKWSDAVSTYKKIMSLNRYSIESQFKPLFLQGMEDNNEFIWAIQYKEGERGEQVTQDRIAPNGFGGESGLGLYQNFVDKFLMKDGKTIEKSPLYDSDNPFENRDPRFYDTILLPGYSKINGKIYYGHPDSAKVTGNYWPGVTGYVLNKFYDPDYEGNPDRYGGSYPLIRYPEVLLSLLESELKAGNPITQNLLDNTINRIRQRPSVDMPRVIKGETFSTNDELMSIIRREDTVELAFEGGLRFWNLLRWHKFGDVFNRNFYGMKLTNNPEEYTGSYQINDKGYLLMGYREWRDNWYLRPIPQPELDVNPNLEQNPGY